MDSIKKMDLMKKLQAQFRETVSEITNKPHRVMLEQLTDTPSFIALSDEKTLELSLSRIATGTGPDNSLVNEAYIGNSTKGFLVACRSYPLGSLPTQIDSTPFSLYDIFKMEIGKIMIGEPCNNPTKCNADIFYGLDAVPAIVLRSSYFFMKNILPQIDMMFDLSLSDPRLESRLNMSSEERTLMRMQEKSERDNYKKILENIDPIKRARDSGLNIKI